jgi:hypothetical protein
VPFICDVLNVRHAAIPQLKATVGHQQWASLLAAYRADFSLRQIQESKLPFSGSTGQPYLPQHVQEWLLQPRQQPTGWRAFDDVAGNQVEVTGDSTVAFSTYQMLLQSAVAVNSHLSQATQSG